MEEIQRRYEQAAERILGNEGLTDDLDDAAAALLLDWGLSWAYTIVAAIPEMPEDEAIELISRRLKANRRLMRYVNRWIVEGSEALPVEPSGPNPILTPYSVRKNRPSAGVERLVQVYTQAAIALGFMPVAGSLMNKSREISASLPVAITAINGQPAEMIRQLRNLLEHFFSDQRESTEQL